MMNGWAVRPFECNEARTSRHCDAVVGKKHSVRCDPVLDTIESEQGNSYQTAT